MIDNCAARMSLKEEGSSSVSELVQLSAVTATSVIAYAEARAAFARRFREKAFRLKDYERIKFSLEQDRHKYFILTITDNLIKLSGNLSEKHALRGFDAIHLASAITLGLELSSSILFSCFDQNLSKAFNHEKERLN